MLSRARSLTAGTAATVLAATLLFILPATARAETTSGCQVAQPYEVCTASPERYANGIDTTIADRILRYIQDQPDGEITVAMYSWDIDSGPKVTTRIADALIAKSRSGEAKVRVILGKDGDRNDSVQARLKDGGVPVKRCDKSCLPGEKDEHGGIMHMKFFLFNGSHGTRVVHTSTNLTGGQLMRHQNMLSIRGDDGLYRNYLGYWNRMREGSWKYKGDEWKGSQRSRAGDFNTKSYFFPRVKADPVRGTLEKLGCQTNPRVWVAASIFENRKPVLDRLNTMAGEGCEVRILAAKSEYRDWVLSNSTKLKPRHVRLLDGRDQPWLEQHNKLIITDAPYDGAPREAVYAGSHNLNHGSLRDSSDGVLRVADPAVYRIYARYYQSMWQLSHT